LGREQKYHKNADLLCIDSSIIDGFDKKKGGNEIIVRQYNYCDKALFN